MFKIFLLGFAASTAGWLFRSGKSSLDVCPTATPDCPEGTEEFWTSPQTFSDEVVEAFLKEKHEFKFDEEKVGFWLYTKRNAWITNKFVFTLSNISRLSESNFDANKNVKVFIHGWGQSGYSYSSSLPRAYLSKQDVNVIMVDWGSYSDRPYLFTRLFIVEEIGKVVAAALDGMSEKFGLSLKNAHVIGHSLGAHVAGFAGKHVKAGKLRRITGLDPAGPAFRTSKSKARLDVADADFIDIIHTDSMGMGFLSPLGNADFYPNMGLAVQPGCKASGLRFNCSHQQSVVFFEESITSEVGFYGQKCKDSVNFKANKCVHNELALMGEYTPETTVGSYYLNTNKKPPYAAGRKAQRNSLGRDLMDFVKKL